MESYQNQSSSPSRLAYSQAFDGFVLTYMPARNWSKATRRGYTYDVSELLEYLDKDGSHFCDQLDVNRINAYLSTLDARGLKGNSRRRKVIAIKAFLTYLIEHTKTLHQDFGSTIIWPAAQEDEPRALTVAEYTRLLEAARGNVRDAAIVMVLLQTGIRLSELTALTVADVTLPAKPSPNLTNGFGEIRVKRKGRRLREIELNYKGCRALHSYLQIRPRYLKAKNADPFEQALFLTKYGKAISNRGVQWNFKKYANEAGIPWAHVHTLRTTHITHHLGKGTDIKTVMGNAGHSNLATTNRYTAYVKEARIKAMQDNAL